jgi:transcriptional regulator with XRE-family HTH domain
MTEKGEPSEAYGADDEANFIKNMQILREQRDWSQGELARRMQAEGWTSFHQTTVSRIEKGERPVRLGEARGIAKVLGTITSQMILPDTQFLDLRELELALIQMKEIQKQFRGLVGALDGQRSIVDYHLREVEDMLLPEDVDPPIVERRDIAMREAREILSKSYNALIEEYMVETQGTSVFEDD